MMNTENQIDEALNLINSDDFKGARELLKQVLKEEPSNIEAYKNLGLCEVNLDNIEGAQAAFLKASELDSKDALSLYYLESCYNKTGDKELAIETYKKVIELRPDYLDAYKNLAMLYVEFADTKEAIEVATKAVENENISPDYSIYYILATSHMLNKDNQKAAEFLSKALELNPEHISIANSLAVCYMNLGEFEKAYEPLKKAYELDEKNTLTIFNLGSYYQHLQNYKEALKYFQASYQLEPSITMLSTLANCAKLANEFSLASSLYKNLVYAYPNNTEFRASYVEILEQTEQFEEALENVNLLLSMDEKNIALIKKKGTLLRKLQKNQESIECFATLLKRGKIDIEVYYNLAFNYVELEDFDNAREMFKKCIILEPQNPYAHKDLGVLYLKMNYYEWAVDEMEEAIALENNVAEFHCALGVAQLMLSRLQEAKNSFEKALQFDPADAESLGYLGYVYLLEKDYPSAYKYLQESLKIAPDGFLAKTYLAKYYYIHKKYDVLKQLLLDIVEKTKDDETMNMLAVAYLETDEFEPAMGIFSKLAVTYPNNHIVLTNLAKCEFKCNKTKEANEHLRQALMIFEDYEPALELLKEINNG